MADTSFEKNIIEGVANGNLKSIAEQPAMLSKLVYSNTVANANLAAQNAVANQQAMNELGVAVTGKLVTLVQNLEPLESKSATEIFTADVVAQQIVDLKAALEAFMLQAPGPKPTPKPKIALALPSNPDGPPYPAQAPLQVVLLNVAKPDDLNLPTVSNDGKVITFTAKDYAPTPPGLKTEKPKGRIPDGTVHALAPVCFSFEEPVTWNVEKGLIEIKSSS
jgi:hypothetical protein